MNVGAAHSMPNKDPEPLSAEVQAIVDAQGIDLESSGLKYLSNEGRVGVSMKLLLLISRPNAFPISPDFQACIH